MAELAVAMKNRVKQSFRAIVASQVLESFGALGRIGVRRPSLDGFRGLSVPAVAARNVKNLHPATLKSMVYLQFLRAHATDLERKNDYAASLDVLKEAAGIAEETGVVELEIVILAQVGNLARRSGDLSSAEQYLTRARKLGEESGVTPVASWVFYEIGYLSFMRGVYADACDWFQKSYEAASQEQNDLVGLVAALGVHGRQHVVMGDIEQGVALYSTAEELINASQAGLDADWVSRWRRNLAYHRAEAEIERGDIEAAARLMAIAEQAPLEQGRPIVKDPYPLLMRSRLEMLCGSLDEAVNLATEAVRGLSGRGRQELEPPDRLRMAEGGSEFLAHYGCVLLQRGQQDAVAKLTIATEYPVEYANSRGHAWAHLALARHCSSQGLTEQAVSHATAAVNATEHHYRPVHEEATRLLASFAPESQE